MSSAAEQNTRLLPLTGLRFFAAFHVVWFHYASPYLGWAPAWVRDLTATGNSGVGLFFVLSGFILALTYLKPGGGPIDKRAFWSARLCRIYPVFLFSLLIAFPGFYGFIQGAYSPEVARQKLQLILPTVLTLTHAWSQETYCTWNCPSWTLSVEAFFYLMFPLLAVLAVRLRARALLLGVGIALAATQLQHLTGWGSPFHPLARLPEFVAGILLGRVFLERHALRAPSARESSLWGAAAVGIAALLVLLLANSSSVPRALWDGGGPLAPLFALLIYALAAGRGPLHRVLSTRPMVLLGEASFSLYILQAPIWEWAYFTPWGAAHRTHLHYFVIFALGLVAVSIVTFKLIEDPARRFLRARLLKPRPPRTEPSVPQVSA